jgi:N-acetylglucosamine kinase-like BadF-type ATPase
MGAARALFGDQPGISCILGTGCNCCYYDGKEIFSRVDSLGYLFGDEGAGSYLGKTFMGAYLKKNLPQDLRAEFDAKYNFTLEDILNSLYNRPYPNRFLASFSEFLVPRQDHPFIQQLIRDSFVAFFNAQVKHYDNYKQLPVSFVGSIAYFYEPILRKAAREEGIQIGTILRAPIDGLISYHG